LNIRSCPPTAKPSSALIPYRSVAAISTSKPASGVPSQYDVNAPQQPISVTGKVKREVPLPSQEGKKGVMQYALYDSLFYSQML
jgi:NADH dehydrogenase (ubiquinone) Fe-S protein 7